MACWTVVIFSASSSGISVSNSSSSAITSSTVSSESAPRSSTNEDEVLISFSLTPSCSAMIFLTRCSTFSIVILPGFVGPRGARILRHIHAAVDVQDRPGDIVCAWRGEVRDRRGDILDLAEPPERDLRQQGFFLLVRQRARHVGV